MASRTALGEPGSTKIALRDTVPAVACASRELHRVQALYRGRRSMRAIVKGVARPVSQPHRAMTSPPSGNRIHASRSGGASSRPSVMATVTPPQNSDSWSARPAPGASTRRTGWLRATGGPTPSPGAWIGVLYNRWYEDDHFNSGAMAMPWMFSGRRWVSPKPLQAMRYPADSAVAQPLDTGKYISIYWLTDGRYDEQHQRRKGE